MNSNNVSKKAENVFVFLLIFYFISTILNTTGFYRSNFLDDPKKRRLL